MNHTPHFAILETQHILKTKNQFIEMVTGLRRKAPYHETMGEAPFISLSQARTVFLLPILCLPCIIPDFY